MPITDYINVRYEFKNQEELNTNGSNQFKACLTPLVNCGFTWVNCVLKYEAKGKLPIEDVEVASLVLEKNNAWIKGQEYCYDITFDLDGDFPGTFYGNNLEIIWFLVLQVKFDKNSQSEIQNLLAKDTRFFNHFKSFDGVHRNKNTVILKNTNPTFEINPFFKTYQIHRQFYILAGVFTLFLLVIFLHQGMMTKYWWLLAIIGIGSLTYGIRQLMSIGILGKIKFQGERIDEDIFLVTIIPEKNHQKIQSALIYYTIIEEVIDTRGSSSSTLRRTAYTSQKIVSGKLKSKNIQVQLEYPTEDIPIDFKRPNVRFYSQICADFVFTNHLKESIKQEFPLTKIA